MSLYANHKGAIKALSKAFPSKVIARFNFSSGVDLATGSKAPRYDEVTLYPVIVRKGALSRLFAEALSGQQITDVAEFTVIVDRALVPEALADPVRRDTIFILNGTQYSVSAIRPLDQQFIVEYDLVRGGA